MALHHPFSNTSSIFSVKSWRRSPSQHSLHNSLIKCAQIELFSQVPPDALWAEQNRCCILCFEHLNLRLDFPLSREVRCKNLFLMQWPQSWDNAILSSLFIVLVDTMPSWSLYLGGSSKFCRCYWWSSKWSTKALGILGPKLEAGLGPDFAAR